MKRIITLFIITIMCAISLDARASEIGDDGLHKQPWFSVTFRDIADDIEQAKAENKRLAMIFEQRGCIYCQKIHEEILVIPEVRDFLKKHFMIVQYNLYGDEEVIDLDGDTLSEKSAARKWNILFTPTILFMPETFEGGQSAKEAAVAAMPGAFRKGTFLDMFTWVQQKGYETDEGFQQFHARSIAQRRAKGKINTD